jgi:5-methylcytosine-specific restriction enzyme subunit McrC
MPILKVFEHQVIKTGDELLFHTGNISQVKTLDEKYIAALWKLYDEKQRPFFTPTRGGIRFCAFVGVIKTNKINGRVF